MKLSTITFSTSTKLLGVVAALMLVPGAVQAQGAADYPSKSISIIAGYPPGTATDIVARIVCERLAVRLGKPFRNLEQFGERGLDFKEVHLPYLPWMKI